MHIPAYINYFLILLKAEYFFKASTSIKANLVVTVSNKNIYNKQFQCCI